MIRFVILLTLIFPVSVFAQDIKCPKGYQPYGNRCVTQQMADYISCVEASGGNKSQIQEIFSEVSGKRSTTGGNISGRGAMVGGSIGAKIDKASEVTLVRQLETKWFPEGMSQCSKALNKMTLERVRKELERNKKDVEKLKSDAAKERKTIKIFEADLEVTFNCPKCAQFFMATTNHDYVLLRLASDDDPSVPFIDFRSAKSAAFNIDPKGNDLFSYTSHVSVPSDALPIGKQIESILPYTVEAIWIPIGVKDNNDLPESISIVDTKIVFHLNNNTFTTSKIANPGVNVTVDQGRKVAFFTIAKFEPNFSKYISTFQK